MRNNKLKTVREKWSHSKFFIGKNRVLSKALGGTEEEEYAEGLSMVARYNTVSFYRICWYCHTLATGQL